MTSKFLILHKCENLICIITYIVTFSQIKTIIYLLFSLNESLFLMRVIPLIFFIRSRVHPAMLGIKQKGFFMITTTNTYWYRFFNIHYRIGHRQTTLTTTIGIGPCYYSSIFIYFILNLPRRGSAQWYLKNFE